MFKNSLLAALLLATTAGAFAQTPATPAKTQQQAPALTPEQKAQIQKQDSQVAQAALGVAQMVDKKQIGEVWDQASSVAKKASSRADFVKQISADRTQLGAPSSRKLAAIGRVQSKGDASLPAGMYINVSFATQFANAKQPVRELVSYHLDSDNIWRVAGYSLR